MWEPYSYYVLDLCQTLLAETPLVLALLWYLCNKPACHKNISSFTRCGVWPLLTCASSDMLPAVWLKCVDGHVLKGHSAYPRLAKCEAEHQGLLNRCKFLSPLKSEWEHMLKAFMNFSYHWRSFTCSLVTHFGELLPEWRTQTSRAGFQLNWCISQKKPVWVYFSWGHL